MAKMRLLYEMFDSNDSGTVGYAEFGRKLFPDKDWHEEDTGAAEAEHQGASGWGEAGAKAGADADCRRITGEPVAGVDAAAAAAAAEQNRRAVDHLSTAVGGLDARMERLERSMARVIELVERREHQTPPPPPAAALTAGVALADGVGDASKSKRGGAVRAETIVRI